MRTTRICLLVAVTLVLAACGSSLAEQDGYVSDPDPTAPPSTTTTMVVDDTTATTTPEPPATTTTGAPDVEAPDSQTNPNDQLGDTEVFVYLLAESGAGSHSYECGDVIAVPRLVQSPEILSGALDALFAGPTDAEIANGYGSWFSTDVGWKLSSVTISGGIAYIDLTEESEPIPNASTSCGSTALMAQLDYTAKQFATVNGTVYSFDGDVAAFYHWLQRDVPEL